MCLCLLQIGGHKLQFMDFSTLFSTQQMIADYFTLQKAHFTCKSPNVSYVGLDLNFTLLLPTVAHTNNNNAD